MADTDSMVTTLLTGTGALLGARMALTGKMDTAFALIVIDEALAVLDEARKRISPPPRAMQWTMDGTLVPPPVAVS